MSCKICECIVRFRILLQYQLFSCLICNWLHLSLFVCSSGTVAFFCVFFCMSAVCWIQYLFLLCCARFFCSALVLSFDPHANLCIFCIYCICNNRIQYSTCSKIFYIALCKLCVFICICLCAHVWYLIWVCVCVFIFVSVCIRINLLRDFDF